ncbi:class I SAM-dependent methyltransferase [Yoonia sediminilitoris]|uniref:SAM-dependent MidA family methyltransferase n=1 Tax=Yoonia sediminilitoris TaxID=1286148 RepID=A0A2T6KQC6_9RHOB|nr:SAM-dependent methyltransferase [Yoonia sediminilitoris]PUB18758.1 SAM-dependent MidA family methyltransferase [Yoonia sediminilitoris]RCW98926.1 SAM-dependent MidA family methyltransferase [Yoonia sediminilitoris]
MSSLRELLIDRIARTGPISLADYMTDCLMHPTLGYYSKRDPLGTAGDFITSPEISQMFGELVGLALAQTWMNQGSPSPFALAELGPGRGTLMADVIRATKAVPGFHAAMSVHLVETSPALRAVQATNVPIATWHDHVDSLPDLPLFVIANEFFDALPIRQFVRQGDAWRERMIGEDSGTLVMGLSDAAPLTILTHRLADTKDGDLIEHCPALAGICATLGARIDRHGGAALIIDYGDWQSLGDTLQAVAGHAKADPLATPGDADLTAHVDFAAIAQNAAPAKFSRLTTQGIFLERLGITERAQKLAQQLAGDALETHIKAHRRLTHPTQMGDLFKVIALYPANAPPPPGLEP